MAHERTRKHFEEWTVLSNGPSIKALSRDDLPAGVPVIAINHAVMHERIAADVWGIHEDHSGIWESLILKAHGPRGSLGVNETWVANGHLKHWRGYIRAQRSHRRRPELDCVPHPNRTNDWLWRHLPWRDSKVRWGDRTIFASIGHAVIRGAKLIRCFGVDMDGAENFGRETCQEEVRRVRRGDAWDQRWTFERAQWEIMVEEGRRSGVTIERISP